MVSGPSTASPEGKLDNVLALLDEVRSRQLLEKVIPAVTYTGTFETVGRDDGFVLSTQLCTPCRTLFRRPPPVYSWIGRGNTAPSLDEEDAPPARFWMPYHDTLFQLIDCCLSGFGSWRICQIIWHSIKYEIFRLRSSQVENRDFTWYDDGLKVALTEVIWGIFHLCLNIILEPADKAF